MKLINEFINEKLTINSKSKINTYDEIIPSYKLQGIKELVSIFKRTILKNNKLSKKDFEKFDDNTYNICNVPQDGDLAKKFFKERTSISKAGIHTEDSSECLKIQLVWPQEKKDDPKEYIRVNIDSTNSSSSNGPLGTWKVGDIISVDVSNNIKNILLSDK